MSVNHITFTKDVVTGHHSLTRVLKRWPITYLGMFLLFIGGWFPSGASAYNLILSDLSNGYSNCSYSENGTDAIFNVTIDYKRTDGQIGSAGFLISRGILLYTYNEKGGLQSNSAVASSMSMNGIPYGSVYNGSGGYSMYIRANSEWNNPWAMIANVTFTVPKSKIAVWPAVGVRAGNFTNGDDVGEIAGVAYIGPSTTGGGCTVVVNPEAPPPAVTPKVTMNAPDWDLGELPRGEETVLTLPLTKDQLCFDYEGAAAIIEQKYLINATNTNGLSTSGRYLLKSLEDSSQTIPYTLTLANSKDSVLLPNTQNNLFSLDAGGRTCFTPTFKAAPDRAIKAGVYSDILTFTVVTKT